MVNLTAPFLMIKAALPHLRARGGSIHPVRRTGTPEEVAALAAFLAAPESGFITGQVYTVNGGAWHSSTCREAKPG